MILVRAKIAVEINFLWPVSFMRLVSLFILSMLFYFSLHAQQTNKDSVLLALKAKPEPYLAFHNRNTFIQSNRTRLYGLVGGVSFNEKVKLYAGIYGYGNADRTLLPYLKFGEDSVVRTINTSNFSLGLEYNFYRNGRFSLGVPAQIGVGSVQYDYRKVKSGIRLSKRDYITVPIESGINAYFSILSWTGLKGGVGYRLNLGNVEAAKLSSPYYNIGLYISIKNLVQEIKN